MGKRYFGKLFSCSIASLVLASCGGGGDIAGQSTEYSVNPDSSTLSIFTTVEGDCSGAAGDPGTTVTIVGGVAPYRIRNSDPARATVDKTEATGKNPTFNVRPTGYACGDVVISVLDYHSNLATFKFTIESKKPEE